MSLNTAPCRVPRNAIVYNAGFAYAPQPVNPVFSLPSCVRLLRERHEFVLASTVSGPATPILSANLTSLRLAEAALEKLEVNRQTPGYPLQLAVIGPTQSGKSSLVNLLLGENRAKVSPLAGYTVNPQAFPLNTEEMDWAWLEAYFHGYRCCSPRELTPGRYDCFSLDAPLASPGNPLPAAVVWDTPDFDSVDANDYRMSVLRTAALADVIILVVSKDKYADQSVWDTMALLQPLGQPTLLCLNKLNADSRDALVVSLRDKWSIARSDPPARTAVLPWVEECSGDLPPEVAGDLLGQLVECCGQVRRPSQDSRVRSLVRAHWESWLAPVRQELAARAEWNHLAGLSLDEALAVYRRDYLDHPHHYETFQRALAELLTLLEIPGLAGGMAAARKVLTWPARQLTRLGKRWRGQGDLGQEVRVLQRTIDHLFIHLGQSLLEKGMENPAMGGFWLQMGLALQEEGTRGESSRTSALIRHTQDFQPEIERTARQLHDKLREQPAVLNALRATRFTTDAAALAMALHTGGIGVQDFVIAPAVLSITSLLAEGALGHFLSRVEAELKERQFRAVEKLLQQCLRPVLDGLPDRIGGEGRFNIAGEMLSDVEAILFSEA